MHHTYHWLPAEHHFGFSDIWSSPLRIILSFWQKLDLALAPYKRSTHWCDSSVGSAETNRKLLRESETINMIHQVRIYPRKQTKLINLLSLKFWKCSESRTTDKAGLLPTRLLMRRANSSMVCSSGFPCKPTIYFHYISANKKKHISLCRAHVLAQFVGPSTMNSPDWLDCWCYCSSTTPSRSPDHWKNQKV